ncbi:hypothetical protein [Loigolactobacillus backii]|uniref:Uncharacterized protein n=1 Tax=Loigolactobacillus backii TaxID=375175 RepID=A0A192H5J2_9LACO|nr:hypothetical protein [Loigolactobacillus backii]ANK59920.1 hypothetical protein AYR52_06385 [Loigolactobacillus backii]ANK63256.1 hypothetical protein AYR53_11050 [Loigolactobacillus backii]ANK64854.1 hypothetical protein AYR54_06065 [Loigolactobacillus backii]ANK66699.1 hypothetical protein AYR55_02690 [Loigolactobacillus backii]ANK69738.1 hypothetical protein AYR56_05955 [Loigolactobacillus backii]
MNNEEIEALIKLTPMKVMTQNMKQVAEAIESSVENNQTDQIADLVKSGNQLLDAISKLSRQS